MNKANLIKNELIKVGKEVFLADGSWVSTPFFAIIQQKWKETKTNFEPKITEIGEVSADYFVYVGPYDHDIEALSDNALLLFGDEKYIFKKKERVVIGGVTQYFWGILRRVWGEDDD